jgi:hypothetical protein
VALLGTRLCDPVTRLDVPPVAPQEAPATAELRTLARGLETPRLIHGVSDVSDLLDGTLDTEMERHLRAGSGTVAYDVATGFGSGEAAVGRLVERLRRDPARGEAAASRVRTLTRWVRPCAQKEGAQGEGRSGQRGFVNDSCGMELSCVPLLGWNGRTLGRTAAQDGAGRVTDVGCGGAGAGPGGGCAGQPAHGEQHAGGGAADAVHGGGAAAGPGAAALVRDDGFREVRAGRRGCGEGKRDRGCDAWA